MRTQWTFSSAPPLLATRVLPFMMVAVMLECSGDGVAPPGGEALEVFFLAPETDRQNVAPCAEAETCPVPATARVTQRFTLQVPERRILGYQWRLQRPGREPGPWEPAGDEAVFLPAGGDTAFTDSLGVKRWELQGDTLAVTFDATLHDSISDLGVLLFTARVLTTIPGRDVVESTRSFSVFESPFPALAILDIAPLDVDLPPCTVAEGCTIPALTDFRIRFTGTSQYDWIDGYTWKVSEPYWLPFYSNGDSLFYPTHRDTVVGAWVGGDTIVVEPDYLVRRWSLKDLILSVEIRAVVIPGIDLEPRPLLPAGPYRFLARVRDDALRVGQGQAVLHLGYPPDTRLYEIPQCDCPAAPPGCENSVRPLGWVTRVARTELSLDEWIPFCAGDTIPQSSSVTFYARGWDDARDPGLAPEGPAEVGYRFRAELERGTFSSRNQPFSSPAVSAHDLLLPGGSTFRGGSVTFWTCPLDYVVQASAVDELGTLDASPAAMPFYVGGAPVLDSLQVRPVVVFVPECVASFPLCVTPRDFGPDTLLVFGHAVSDDPIDPQTPLGLGYNDFELPLKAWGHDHPRDRNAPGRQWYTSETEGRIRSWWVRFDCTTPGCRDTQIPHERVWQRDIVRATDPPGHQVFDEGLNIRIALDTLCLSEPCRMDSLRVRLEPTLFGDYEFILQGRDTESIAHDCVYPSDLGANASLFHLDISSLGLATERIVRQVHWRQLVDVRPPESSAPAP